MIKLTLRGKKKRHFITAAVVLAAAASMLILFFYRTDKAVTDTFDGNKESEGGITMDTNDDKVSASNNGGGREGIEAMGKAAHTEEISKLRDPGSTDGFKIIGYFPSWHGDMIDQIPWEKLTHINYAFAIPTASAEIRNFPDNELVKKLVMAAHENKVKAAVSVGGWSYEDVTLEDTFVQATGTDEKCRRLADNILKLVDDYGFDGVDMDWEYPKAGISDHQYEFFMTILRQGLTARGKYLTAAVVGNGSTGEGQTDYILDMLDWINVMAYDGGNGEGHSPYSFAVDCGKYWINTRKMEQKRVVLGVPFYERPGWTSYADIVAADEEAAYQDSTEINGTVIYYNGLLTIADKTEWACINAGGIMIWEITQDSQKEDLSLLNQINKKVIEYFPDFKK
jgi:GH18 family chitinase